MGFEKLQNITLITAINKMVSSLLSEKKGGSVCYYITSGVNVLKNIKDDSPFSQENTSCQKTVLFQKEFFHYFHLGFL